jgi:hypothetical protein
VASRAVKGYIYTPLRPINPLIMRYATQIIMRELEHYLLSLFLRSRVVLLPLAGEGWDGGEKGGREYWYQSCSRQRADVVREEVRRRKGYESRKRYYGATGLRQVFSF